MLATDIDTIEGICRLIADNAAELISDLDPASMSFDRQLEDYGLNSIDRVETLLKTLGDLGLDVPLVRFARSCSILALATRMRDAATEAAGERRP